MRTSKGKIIGLIFFYKTIKDNVFPNVNHNDSIVSHTCDFSNDKTLEVRVTCIKNLFEIIYKNLEKALVSLRERGDVDKELVLNKRKTSHEKTVHQKNFR